MDRRTMITRTAVATAALSWQSVASAADSEKKDPHAGHGASQQMNLAQAASNCASKGEACLAHCIVVLGEGDKTIAPCAKSVREMIAICRALSDLAAGDSARTKDLARIAAKTCKDCESECRKHEMKHAICKQCADSCATCADECNKAMT